MTSATLGWLKLLWNHCKEGMDGAVPLEPLPAEQREHNLLGTGK